MSNQHARTWEWAFSLNKQADMFTACADAKINKERSIRTFAPSREVKARISDKDWFGKGHSWPTFSDQITRHLEIATAERSATSLEALFAAAFVMGNVTTTQPDSGGNPTLYQHVIKWQSLATNKEVLYTSFFEKMGAEYENKLSGGWISQFKLTGDRKDHVKLSYQGGARKQVTSAFAMPGITTASFYKTLFGLVSFGASGGAVDISNAVWGWELTVNQNPQMDWMMGNSAGDEMLLSNVFIGNQEVSFSVDLKIDVAMRNRFLNQDDCELSLICRSPDLVGAQQHQMTILVPHFKITDEAFSENGQMVDWKMTIGPDSTLKVGASEHLQITFLTNIGSTELLVTG